MTDDRPFWQAKPLSAMTEAEWESLCDGCGKCCLVKLEDVATGDIKFTDVTCRLLDAGTCRCRDYPNRQSHVPDCVRLSPDSLAELTWMPDTCAYRLLYEGEDLPWWHPLLSGDPETVHLAGMSVRGRVVPETAVRERDLPRHIVEWATN